MALLNKAILRKFHALKCLPRRRWKSGRTLKMKNRESISLSLSLLMATRSGMSLASTQIFLSTPRSGKFPISLSLSHVLKKLRSEFAGGAWLQRTVKWARFLSMMSQVELPPDLRLKEGPNSTKKEKPTVLFKLGSDF